MRDKKDQKETLNQSIQKYSIGKKEVSKAPTPITPVSGFGATLPRPPKTDPPEKPYKPITGTKLMKRWSVGWEAVFHLAEQGKLIPEGDRFRKNDFDMLLKIYTPEDREEYFSAWWYCPNKVEAFEAQHGNILDDWRKEVVASEFQASGTTKPIRWGNEREFRSSPDFRSIRKDEKEFTLTPKQAQVVEILYESQEAGTPDLGQAYIIDTVSGESSTKRIKDFFRKTPEGLEAYNQLIEHGNKKGTFRLRK